MDDHCEIPRCRRHADLIYLGHGICSDHWNNLTNENAPADAMRIALGIPAAHAPFVEDTNMSKPKKQQTEQPAESNQTADAPAPEKKVKTSKTTKAEKPAKPKREQREKEEGLVVFAFRLTPAERDAIHKAAGPGGASRFVRAIAIAAANEDEAAIKAVLMEAGELR